MAEASILAVIHHKVDSTNHMKLYRCLMPRHTRRLNTKRERTMIRHGIQCRARTPTITLLRSCILGPDATSTRTSLRNDILHRQIRPDEVGYEQSEIPDEYRSVRQNPDERRVEAVRDAADSDHGERWRLVRHGGRGSGGVRRRLHALYRHRPPERTR